MTLVRQMLRDAFWIALGYAVIMEVGLLAAVLYWPELRDNLPAIAKLIPFETVRDMVTRIEEEGFWAYFVFQQFFKGTNLFGMAAAAILGSGMVAREADNRTAEFLLSRPVTRTRILLVRWATGVVLVDAPILLTSLSGMAITPLVDESLEIGPILLCSAYVGLFLALLFTITVWLSACFVHQIKAGAVMVGFGLLQFALYLVKVVGDWSIFRLVDMEVMVEIPETGFPWVRAGGITAATLLFLALALRQFERRDF